MMNNNILECRSIIRAEVLDEFDRNLKSRWVLVLSNNKEIQENDFVHVLAITSTPININLRKYIEIPFGKKFNNELTTESWVVCTWFKKVQKNNIIKIGGKLFKATYKEILKRRHELLG